MPTIINNFEWMTINVSLALIPVVLTYLIFKYSNRLISLLFFLCWILFLPNTIYLITDLEYLPHQLSKINGSFDLILISQYLLLTVIGIITYFYSTKVAVIYFRSKPLIFAFNFLISFAVALGKIQRTESWDIILNPGKTIMDISRSFHSPQIISFVFLFGLLINIIFFSKEILKGLRARH